MIKLGVFSLDEANGLVSMQNGAMKDLIYGEKLYYSLMLLGSEKSLKIPELDIIFMYSVAWPSDVVMESIERHEL